MPDHETFFLNEGRWADFPKKLMLERVAKANIANLTGDLDWNRGANPLGSHFKPIDCYGDGKVGFCDNLVLMNMVPDYQIKIETDPEKPRDGRSQKYTLLGYRCTQIRSILDEHGIAYTDVSPARVYDTTKVPQNTPNYADAVRMPQNIDATTVPGLDTSKKVSSWYKQLIIVHTPNNDMQAVIDLIRSGEFAKWGLYLNDFDVTIDLAGSFNKEELIQHMLKQHGWAIEKKAHNKKFFQNKTILNNSHKVGKNCLTWMISVPMGGTSYNVRLKFYLKLVQEFEKQKVRSECGHHIDDWIEMLDTRLAHARDMTVDTGLTRCEATIYFNDASKPINTAHTFLPAAAADVEGVCLGAVRHAPPELLKRTPHNLMVSNWCSVLKHTLVVADAWYNCALVVYAKNEVTDTIAATHVTNWARRSRYVLQRLTLAEHPVELIVVNRSANYAPTEIAIPDITSKTKRRKMARSNVHQFVDVDADSINQLMLEDVGITAAESESGEDDSDGEGEPEPEAEPVDGGEADDDGDDVMSTSTCATELMNVIPGKIEIAVGGIAFTTTRFHRFSSDNDVALLTEIPRGGLGHYFNPPNDTLVRAVGAAAVGVDAEARQGAVDNLIERLCTSSGFRPLDDLHGVHVEPRTAKFRVSNKNTDITLRTCESALTVDLVCIQPATKHSAYGMSKRLLATHKEVILRERMRVRLLNVAAGAAERGPLQRAQNDMLAAIELTTQFVSLYGQKNAASIRAMRGEFEIAGIQINSKSKTHVLFLRNQETELAPFAALKPIDQAMNAHAAVMRNSLALIPPDAHKRSFLVAKDFTTGTIGTLTLGDPVSDGHGRKVPRIGLTIADARLLIPIDELANNLAAAAATEDGYEHDAATLVVTDQLKRDAVYFQTEIQIKKGETPAVFVVVATAVTTYKSHGNKLMLNLIRVGIDSNHSAEAKVYWGGPTLNARAAGVAVGGYIVVYETKAKDYKLDVDVVSPGPHNWACHLPRSYDNLTPIKLGMETDAIAIVRCGSHRNNDNPIVMDGNGKVWRFAAPQNVKPNAAKNQRGILHLLVPGAVIKTAKPKMVVLVPGAGNSQ